MALKILAVVGARPNFMKVAPLIWEAQRRGGIAVRLVHTGQHYDEKMSQLFFDELRLPRPDVNLEVGSGSHAVQTAEVMKRFEPVVTAEKPDLVLVVGDVNSTIACALTAVKLLVPEFPAVPGTPTETGPLVAASGDDQDFEVRFKSPDELCCMDMDLHLDVGKVVTFDAAGGRPASLPLMMFGPSCE